MSAFIFPGYFEINGISKVPDQKEVLSTSVFARDEIYKIAHKIGKKFVYITIYPTNLSKSPFEKNSVLSNNKRKKNIAISVFEMDKMIFNNIASSVCYDPSLTLAISNKQEYISGNYLMMLHFHSSLEDFKSKGTDLSNKMINLIRLTYGLGAAAQPVYEGTYDLQNNKATRTGKVHMIYIEEFSQENDKSSFANFENIPFFKIDDFILSPDADILFKKAVSENDVTNRFLFLWLCLETLAPSEDRRTLFEDKLSSYISNKEVFRLFKLRCSLVHEGKSKVTADDCHSALWSIRIASCPNRKIQKILSDEYENWIISKNFKLPNPSHQKRLEASFDKDDEIHGRIAAMGDRLGMKNAQLVKHALNELWEKQESEQTDKD